MYSPFAFFKASLFATANPVVGHIAEKEKGTNIITKGGNTYPLTAQGWNALAG
jgi:hypothetical protein